MNTVRSFWLGWGSLCVAGGGAYIFAKRQINADRRAKSDELRQQKRNQRSLEYESLGSGESGSGPARTDHTGSPSSEAGLDPAPTRHAPTTDGQRVMEKSKYESSQPYRPRKGDRFS